LKKPVLVTGRHLMKKTLLYHGFAALAVTSMRTIKIEIYPNKIRVGVFFYK
jgi:hypothetical protein